LAICGLLNIIASFYGSLRSFPVMEAETEMEQADKAANRRVGESRIGIVVFIIYLKLLQNATIARKIFAVS
jgi:hypothetical protein